MKLIALLLTFCLSFNVLASSGTVQELEEAIDNYTYNMTVEWDQKDQDFFEQQSAVLGKKIQQLKANGLTAEQMLSVVKKKIGKEQFEALELQASLGVDMETILKDQTQRIYARGANWNGSETDVIITVGGIILFISLVWEFGIERS